MLVALYLTSLPAPRLYGVQVERVLDIDTLRAAAVQADVLITDTAFDNASIPVKRCCVLRGGVGVESFAKESGYDCIDATQLADWFKKRVGIDVTRRARQATQDAPVVQVPAGQKAVIDNSKLKLMYDGLVAELRKSAAYAHLDPNDAKTYDVLLQTVRGTLRKADSVLSEMSEVQRKLVDAEAKLAQLSKQQTTTDEDLAVVLSGLLQAVTDCTSVLTKITHLTDDPELVLFSGVSVKARAAIGLASKFSSVAAAKELRAVGSVMREFISCVAGIVNEILSLGSDAVKASAGAQMTSRDAAVAKANAERALQQIKEQLAQEEKLVESLRQQLAELNTAYQEQVKRTAEVENQLLVSGGTSIQALQEQIRTLRFELQSKAEQIARMEEAVDSTVEDSNNVLAPEVATGIIRQLRTQVAALKLERDRATAELAKARSAALKEAERAETLTASARSLSQVALRGSQVSALPLFNYTAKALIITVFGNGSTGISSSAVSLAKMLGVNARTVLVDFDLMCTDLEGRFGSRINPLVKLDDGDVSGKNTAMGLFIDRGKDFFASHYAELVVRIDSNKAGILDYLPGFYAKPDLFMLTQADYTTLLNFLGGRYDYIVIDAGKIGCSEIGDQILHNLCLCSFRSLIVTDASVEKARAMRLKLNDVFGPADIRKVIERCVWLTNRAPKREDLTRFTAPAQTVSIPILLDMVGVHESFHITTSAQKEFNKVVRALAGV